ncbi:unnamed protein product [Linum tenue]|uniref:DUF4371 domain-containing protein n=1 Tax=Linum tenue TaxID=586396 RepID=A0AAV0HCF8_9ROSI|nr:unnamed protein product [Linum tenue]
MHQPGHIDKVMKKQTSEEVKKNITPVKTSIDDVRYLALQGVSFRGRDETADSKNPGNFIQLLEYTRFYNEEVNSVVLENAPKNAKYTSHEIQKQILHVLARSGSKFLKTLEILNTQSLWMRQVMKVGMNTWPSFFALLMLKDLFKSGSSIWFMSKTRHQRLCTLLFAQLLLPLSFPFIIFVDKDMTVLVTCVVNGKDCKHSF